MYFRNKLLKALLAPFLFHVDDASGGGGFDMSSAVDSVAEGLGLGLEEKSNDGGNADAGTGGGDAAGSTGGDADTGGGTGDDDQSGGEGDKKPPEASTGDAKGQTPDASGKPAGTPAPVVAPRTWRPEAAAAWETLPQAVKDEVLKREEDMFRGLEGYKEAAAKGKAFGDVFAPFAQILQQAGADQVALTKEFLNAHMTFTMGAPAQKQALLDKILDGYDLRGFVAPTTADPNAPFVAPEVQALQKDLKAVQSQLADQRAAAQREAQSQQAQIRAKMEAEVAAFEADPANIHFKDVMGMIPQLLQSGLAKGLKDAYEQAVMLNPLTREKELARRTAEASAKAEQEAKAKAEAARAAAAANVRTKAKQASGTAPLGSIDDTLKAAYARMSGS